LPIYCYKSWEQSKKDEEKRRREKEKSISNKMAKKRKEEEIKKLEAQFMDSGRVTISLFKRQTYL